ncbi:MAG: hypothetical protein EOO14_03215, partial [Chitinophagaceae bacterium]
MKAVIFFFIYSSFFLAACAQPEAYPVPRVTEHLLPVGDATITVEKTSFDSTLPYFFVHLHANELTAAEAAQQVAAKEGIPLLRIINGEDRLLSFRQNSQVLRIDPNRIFSNAGIQKTIKLLNKESADAFAAVKGFRDTLLTLIDTGKIVIALHNNTNERFSILQYKADSALVH